MWFSLLLRKVNLKPALTTQKVRCLLREAPCTAQTSLTHHHRAQQGQHALITLCPALPYATVQSVSHVVRFHLQIN